MYYKRLPTFIHYTPTKIIFREHSTEDLNNELKILGANRILLITDKELVKLDIVEKAKKLLCDKCIYVYSEVIPDSNIEIVNDGYKIAKEIHCDCLVSIGGGSTIDTAKAIGILLKKGGDIRKYIGVPGLQEKIIPHIAIPTTAGTGSEVTCFAVIKDSEKKIKIGIADRNIIPDVAILDPVNTLQLPQGLTSSSGMDALSHAIEAMHSIRTQPVTDALALYSIQLIFAYLPICYEDPKNILARGMQLLASNIAGSCTSNAMAGIVHALSHALGGKFGIPHGIANAIFLPYGMKFNLDRAKRRYSLIAQGLGIKKQDMSDEEASYILIEKIKELCKKLNLPQKLRDVGVQEQDLSLLAKETSLDGNIMTNIKPAFDEQEILKILKEAY